MPLSLGPGVWVKDGEWVRSDRAKGPALLPWTTSAGCGASVIGCGPASTATISAHIRRSRGRQGSVIAGRPNARWPAEDYSRAEALIWSRASFYNRRFGRRRPVAEALSRDCKHKAEPPAASR